MFGSHHGGATELKSPFFVPQKYLLAPKSFPDSFQSFQDLKYTLLNIIGQSRKRFWIYSDFLSDGEVVSALYIAKYRKLGVRVYLDREKAYNYMSRLKNLQNQKIPVYYKPEPFPVSFSTVIISDMRVFFINGDLDFLTSQKGFAMSVLSKTDSRRFLALMQDFKNERPKNIKVWQIPDRPIKVQRIPVLSYRRGYRGNLDGSYNYDLTNPLNPPIGIAKSLPVLPKFRQASVVRRLGVISNSKVSINKPKPEPQVGKEPLGSPSQKPFYP